MDKNSTIGILGCGWLGKATARLLVDNGYFVKGTTTSREGFSALLSLGVKPYHVHLKPQSDLDNLAEFLSDLNVLVIAIPPKLNKTGSQLLEAFKVMFTAFDFTGIERLIYVSSTGVFKDDINAEYDEDSIPNQNSERGKHLIALEDYILNQKQFNTVVIRYGGLIKHNGRHPIHYLSGRKNIQNPDAAVNLIEQKDAARLLYRIIETSSCSRKFYHGVYPDYPSRKEYYTRKANILGLKSPEFDNSKPSIGKKIFSEKTQRELGIAFTSGI